MKEQRNPPASTPSDRIEIGPQYPRDNAFTARMRRHQSWYRATVLRVPHGTGSKPTSTTPYGNMLRREDGARGLNFLHPEIHEIAKKRSGQGVQEFRNLNNMLSSQPMCFNLFGLFVKRRCLATRLMRTIPELELDEVLDAKIEYAPEPKSQYLGDRTAFDAFIDYRRKDGSRAILGIETKLTEPFSPDNEYDRPEYRRWMKGPRAPWTDEAGEHVAHIRHNQLWRNHLLAIAMRDRKGSVYQHGTLMLVRHPEDHSCARVVEGYRELLRPGDSSFIDMPLDRLIEAWRGAVDEEHRRWLEEFERRYVDMSGSEGVG